MRFILTLIESTDQRSRSRIKMVTEINEASCIVSYKVSFEVYSHFGYASEQSLFS